MNEKQCAKCGETKSLAEFCKRTTAKSGIGNFCNPCESRRTILQRRKDKARLKATAPELYELMKMRGRENSRKYYATHRAKEQARSLEKMKDPTIRKRHKERADPVKQKARFELRNAVQSGRVLKPKRCQLCSTLGLLHGHHADYSKPLDVMWLCSICHGKQHRTEALRPEGE